MAATDQTYRSQRTLDIVFGVSCVLMLVSVVWMFAQDYNREFKHVQREFRDVDEALTERAMIEKLPTRANLDEASQAVTTARKNLDDIKAKSESRGLIGEKARLEGKVQAVKADYDSAISLLNIAVENRDAAPDPDRRRALQAAVDKRQIQANELEQRLIEAQRELDKINKEIRDREADQRAAEKTLSEAEDRLKSISGDFDRFAKATAQKRWKLGDTIRELPVLDAFASPVKIQQFTLNDYPIDYAFKYVTRFDRCMT